MIHPPVKIEKSMDVSLTVQSDSLSGFGLFSQRDGEERKEPLLQNISDPYIETEVSNSRL